MIDVQQIFFYTIPLYINRLILNLFLLYCRFVTNLKYIYNHCYEYNSSIKKWMDDVYYWYSVSKGAMLGLRVEPNSKYWISSCCLSSQVLSNEYEMDEYIFPMSEDRSIETIIKYLDNMYEISKNYLKRNVGYNDFLFVISDGEYQHYRICNKDVNIAPTSLSREPAFVSFINIEIYIEGHKKSPFYVLLNRDVYLVDNVLFTPTFVKRLLEYNVGSNVFDINYTIKLMDSDIRFLTLNSSQYIVLEKNGYRVVNVKKMDSVHFTADKKEYSNKCKQKQI